MAPGPPTTSAGSLAPADADLIAAALATLQPLSAGDQGRLSIALQQARSPIAPPPAGQPWTTAHVTAQVASSWSGAAGGGAGGTGRGPTVS